MYIRLRREVEKTTGEVIRLTQKLVRIPSPSLHEEMVAGKVDAVMRGLRYDHVFTDDVGNVVGVILGSDPGLSILISSYMDTKMPEGVESWRRSPFSGDIVHGRIEGIGAADSKGGLAAQIYAGHVLSTSGLAPKGNIVVAATVAGENGVGVGIRHLLKTTLPELGMKPDFVVLGDPTTLMIGSGHDGWLEFDVNIVSPVNGVARNAAEYMFKELYAHCVEDGSPGPRAAMTVNHPRPGLSDNGFLETIRLCRRWSHGESEEDVFGCLKALVLESAREMGDVFVDVRVHQEEQMLYTGHRRLIRLSVPSWSTALMHPLVDRARQSMKSAGCRWVSKAWELDALGVGSAGGVVSRELGIPTISYGPGEEEQAHACNESVGLPALVDAVYGTATLMNGLSMASLVRPTEVVRATEERLVAIAGGGGNR